MGRAGEFIISGWEVKIPTLSTQSESTTAPTSTAFTAFSAASHFSQRTRKMGHPLFAGVGLSKSKSHGRERPLHTIRINNNTNQRLSLHAALPPTFRKGREKWGTLCLPVSGCQSQNPHPLHTIRINNNTNVNGFHCMWRCLPLFAKDAKNGAPFVCRYRGCLSQNPQRQHQRQRLSLHAALPPTLRLRSGQAFSQRTRKMGHPLFAGIGLSKSKSPPSRTGREKGLGNPPGAHPAARLAAMRARSLDPLVKTRVFGMTPLNGIANPYGNSVAARTTTLALFGSVMLSTVLVLFRTK